MLVFDLDDTLYLERDFAFSGYAHLEGWAQDRLGVEGFGTLCGEVFDTGDRRRIFNVVCDRLGIDLTDTLLKELVSEYRFHPPRITLAPDAERCLARHRGARAMGLITDGPAQMQHNKIAALGLSGLFAPECVTGDWPQGFGKPHPRAYEAMEAAEPDGRHIYVADNPAKDFVTPNARGWLTVQIVREGGVHDPKAPDTAHAAQAVIESLDALDNLL